MNVLARASYRYTVLYSFPTLLIWKFYSEAAAQSNLRPQPGMTRTSDYLHRLIVWPG